MLLGIICPSLAAAHGIPIEINVADDTLVVSHPENDYPALIFGQVDDESDPIGPVTLPGIGSALLWEMPGLDIYDMADSASLVFEPIAHQLGATTQTLWYWNPTSRRVVATPSEASLVLQLSDRDVTLQPNQPAEPITIADTVEGETGYHNHSLMDYAMPYSASSFNLGLYGVFGRLSSNEYGSSEMFLMIFNAGAAYEDLAPASEAMWLAANPGDYTLDGVVDAADYNVWADNYGATPAMVQTAADGNGDGVVDAADYTVWRDAFTATTLTIPEPTALVLAGILTGLVMTSETRAAERRSSLRSGLN